MMELFLKFLKLLLNYKSSMLRCCKTSSSFLVLLWMFIAYDAVFSIHFSTDIIYRNYLLAICYGGCVISGCWLADVYIGRYRCIRYSSRIAWVGTIALNTYYLVQNYLWQPQHTADIVTQTILIKWSLNSAPVKPVLWKRYVDDTFCIDKKGSEKHLLDHLNSVRPIKFTMESDEDSKLPFLDCLLKRERESDGMLTSTVYRKSTHTDRYLHFKSHHPNHVKRGIVRCLYQRARRVI